MNNRGLSGGFSNAPAPAPKAADARATTGAVAVQQSKRARAQQEVMRVDEGNASSAIKTAGGKTFYLREGVWTDSELKPGATLPETAVKFGSDEYFALLKQKPQLGAFFSLGESVVVIFDGRIYRVNAAN
jgi:Ca-activated chloride channel family protein